MFEFSRSDMGNNTWEPELQWEKKKKKQDPGERRGEEKEKWLFSLKKNSKKAW